MAPLLPRSLRHSPVSAPRAGRAGGAHGFLSGDRAAASHHLPMIVKLFSFKIYLFGCTGS